MPIESDSLISQTCERRMYLHDLSDEMLTSIRLDNLSSEQNLCGAWYICNEKRNKRIKRVKSALKVRSKRVKGESTFAGAYQSGLLSGT